MTLPTVPTPFLFNAQMTSAHDGDTATFTVDRGDRDYSTWTIRFAGCNARELAMPGGVEARDEVRRRVPPGTPCVLATVTPDKYSERKDARIFYAGPDGVVHDLVAELAADGWVALWDGTGKQPIPPWPRTPPPPAPSTERSTVTRYDTATDREVEPKVKAAAAGAGGGGTVALFIDYELSVHVYHGSDVPGPVQAIVLLAVTVGLPVLGAMVSGYLARHVNRSQAAAGGTPPPLTVGQLTAPPVTADLGWNNRCGLLPGGSKHAAPDAQPNRRIPETVVAGKRLGRHVHHDPRSLNYLVPATATPTTVFWQRRVDVFDQGNTGSCTGNAAAGVLGTSPFFETLPTGFLDDENQALKLYSSATKLDGYPGSWPPDDTGSDGLSVAKAAKAAGLIVGYLHITSVAAAHTAIQAGPFITGVNWYSGMDSPDAHGQVKVSGTVRGGHEFECHGYDAVGDLWWFTNSWGTGWGANGRFCMTSADFARLLSEQGDATVFTPLAAPAPQPPAPPAPGPANPFPVAELEAFLAHPFSKTKMAAFIAAAKAWLQAGGAS